MICLAGDKVHLIQRMLMQVEHILQFNEHHTVTKEVIGTEREQLLNGLTCEAGEAPHHRSVEGRLRPSWENSYV